MSEAINITRDTSEAIEFFENEDTLPNVNWGSNETKTLYARWQEKTYKVRYYGGNAQSVAFSPGRKITPPNGNSWNSLSELFWGYGYHIYQYENDDVKWKQCSESELVRILKTKTNEYWDNFNDLSSANPKDFYFLRVPIQSFRQTDVTGFWGSVDENDNPSTDKSNDPTLISCERSKSFIIEHKGTVVDGEQVIIKQEYWIVGEQIKWIDGADEEQSVDITDSKFTIDEVEYEISGGQISWKESEEGSEITKSTPINNKGWNGNPEELGNVDLDVGYITKQNGMDWASLQDLNNNVDSYYSYGQKVSAIAGDYAVVNGKWYSNGSEITPSNGDYAYVNENSELQMWTYDNGGWRIIEDVADEDTTESIEDNAYYTRHDGKNWTSLSELNQGDSGKWYYNGEGKTREQLSDGDPAIVESGEDERITYTFNKTLGVWEEYKENNDIEEYIQTVQINRQANLKPNKFTRDGFEFKGWCTQPTEDIPAYVDTGLGVFQENGITIYQQLLNSNYQMNTVPLAQRDGYDFLGWYTSDGAEFAKGFYVTKDITVYPKWKVADPTPSPTPTPTPEPEQEPQDDNPGSEPTSSGLAPEKFKVDHTSGTGIGLCGNILYSNFNGGKDVKGKALKNCKLYGTGGTTCSHYKANCTTKIYTHPDAPGKKFMLVPVFPGKDLSKIKLKSTGEETNIPQDMVEYINKNVSWHPGWDPSKASGKNFKEKFPNWNNYDWANFGQRTSIPAIQWPGHKFLGWYLGYDACTSKDTTRPIEGSYDKLYCPEGSSAKESFYICADYLQKLSCTEGKKTNYYKGFIFYPRFD